MNDLIRSNLLRRAWNIAGGVSIRVKVLGIVLSVIIALGVIVIYQIRDVLTTRLIDSLETQGIALAGSMADLVSNDVGLRRSNALVTVLQEQQSHYSSNSHNTRVEFIYIANDAGEVLASSRTLSGHRPIIDAPEPIKMHDDAAIYFDGTILEIARPIRNTGWNLHLGLSSASISQTAIDVTLRLLVIMLIMIAVGFAAAIFLTWILTRPILDLVAATDAVAQGDFSRRVPRWADDEIGELATAFNAMTEALETAAHERAERDRLREQYISGVIVAQENERKRIARELHDSTGQSLTALLVGLQDLKQAQANGNSGARIDRLREVVSHALDEVRGIAWRLRPSVLDDLGLPSALERLADQYQRQQNMTVDLVMRGLPPRLPQTLETAIYRIVQEGLTNIARYAQAQTASVVIGQRDDSIRIIIEDDGVGFDPKQIAQSSKSLGLQGIRERAGLFGGTLEIDSTPGGGTSLFIAIPFQPEAQEEIQTP
ncbi:MAG: HAMP domain-containing protein [Anaerolineae bacterium]|nr:HAMP domain-containing protein [Anaerolineae bacterium]